jgi:dihydropyrimidine dehydrogenase (NAD+) subunit PreT
LAELEASEDGSLVPIAGETISLPVDLIVLAIGQGTRTEFLKDGKVKLERGRIAVDRATGQTSNAKYFAGGDCTNGGREVVDAVADGKRAGVAMAAWLGGQDANA